MKVFIFQGTLLLYLASALGYVVSLIVARVTVARVATGLFGVALLCHSAYMALRLWCCGWGAVTAGHEFFSFAAWVTACLYLVFQFSTKTRVLGACVSPAVFVSMVWASGGAAGDAIIPDILRGPWFFLHVVLTVVGEAFFAIACFAGLMYVVKDRYLRRKQLGGLADVLPSLGELDRVNHIAIIGGFAALTLGMIAGSIWARDVWGAHWQWDPKQSAALIVWCVYGVLVHQRLAIGWKGKKAAYFSMAAFFIMIAGFAGVYAFLNTVHRFM